MLDVAGIEWLQNRNEATAGNLAHDAEGADAGKADANGGQGNVNESFAALRSDMLT